MYFCIEEKKSTEASMNRRWVSRYSKFEVYTPPLSDMNHPTFDRRIDHNLRRSMDDRRNEDRQTNFINKNRRLLSAQSNRLTETVVRDTKV